MTLFSWFLKLTPRDWPRKDGDKNVCIPLKSVQKSKKPASEIPANEAGKITWVWFDVGFAWLYFMECTKIDCSQFPVFPCSRTCTNNEKQFSLMCFVGNVNVWNITNFYMDGAFGITRELFYLSVQKPTCSSPRYRHKQWNITLPTADFIVLLVSSIDDIEFGP